jgi:hypothetical protein
MTQSRPATQTAPEGFVSIQRSPLDETALQALISRCIPGDAWHCLRWPHDTLFGTGLQVDLSAPEGQVFNQHRELRWKRQNDGYEVLVLSSTPISDTVLRPLLESEPQPSESEPQWLIRDLNAHFYPATETRLPRGVAFPKALDIGQRYFIHRETGMVQFVALRGRTKHGQ